MEVDGDSDENSTVGSVEGSVELSDVEMLSLSDSDSLSELSGGDALSDVSEATVMSDVSDMSDDIEMENVPEEEYRPFYQRNEQGQFPHPNANQHRPDWLPRDHFYTKLAAAVASSTPYERVIEDFEIYNAGHENPTLPKDKEQLWKAIGRNTTNVKTYVYCGDCKMKVGNGKIPTRDCRCGSTGPERKNRNLHTFQHVSVRAQLIELLRRPNMLQALNYRNTRVKQNVNGMEDIYDGRRYVELLLHFLANRNNFSLGIWLDALRLAKSSKVKAYAVLLMWNELSPHARKRNMILGGVFVGSGTPCMNAILKPIILELNSLYDHGITWTPFEGGVPRTSRFITTPLICDSDARYDLLQMTRFNGFMGCTFCFAPGERINRHNHFYTARGEPAPLRTHEDIIEDMEAATETGYKIRGVKGLSIFALLAEFNLSSGVVVDSFHSIYEGIAKKFTNVVWERSLEPIDVMIIDMQLDEIRTPTRLARRPRSLLLSKIWKGTEWRNFFIYYAPVVLKDILPDDEHRLLMKLAEAVYLIHKTSITPEELDEAENLLNEAVLEFQDLFGDIHMVYTVHLLLHIVRSVRDYGPGWVFSGAIFEAWNRKFVDNCTSPNDRATQIVQRFLLIKFLENVLLDGDLHPEAQRLMSKYLQKARWDVPPAVATGRFFQGVDPNIENPEPNDLLAIQNADFQMNLNFQLFPFRRFKTANIHGTMYKEKDESEPRYCNHFVHSTAGFYICKKLVSFYDVNGVLVDGIIGIWLQTRQPIFGSSYIRPYVVREDRLRFIPSNSVLSPAISIPYNRESVIVPLANCQETD